MSQYATQPIETIQEESVTIAGKTVCIRLMRTHLGKYRIFIDDELMAEAPSQMYAVMLFDMVREHLNEY